MSPIPKKNAGSDLRVLWRQFLPLSLSDVTMALGDPLVTATLTHMAQPQMSLAAVGVAKAVAVFFESPIIMMLHASNALARARASRQVLWRFMLLAALSLTIALLVLTIPFVFDRVSSMVFGISGSIRDQARLVLTLLVLWPAAIAWRRYFQGLLIHAGHSAAVGRCGALRVAAIAAALGLGFKIGLTGVATAGVATAGVATAGVAMISGVMVEAFAVTLAAWRLGAARPPALKSVPGLPKDMKEVWRFYWPLANAMLVVWGGRILLLGVIARAIDGPAAIAVWTASWGLILVTANSTRMVQQVVIRNRGKVRGGVLFGFAAVVGGACSLGLLGVATTPSGRDFLAAFLGGNPVLIAGAKPALLIGAGVPLFVALQNTLQGYLIGDTRTHRIHVAALIGTAVMLAAALLRVKAGLPGAEAAAGAMLAGLIAETACLAGGVLWRRRDVSDLPMIVDKSSALAEQ
ncbi:MAG: hypothetical protein HKL90_15540 [Elusimicrobia bacterium]|nr:hypothetical protein [Elusimicrobiota bacterium]